MSDVSKDFYRGSEQVKSVNPTIESLEVNVTASSSKNGT